MRASGHPAILLGMTLSSSQTRRLRRCLRIVSNRERFASVCPDATGVLVKVAYSIFILSRFGSVVLKANYWCGDRPLQVPLRLVMLKIFEWIPSRGLI
eukprot:scaffold10472_cov126-Cylindrotheca_fusiformis.AAC.9